MGDRLHPGGAPHVLAHIPRRERHRPTRAGHTHAGDAKREDLAGREGAARLLQNHLPGMDLFVKSSLSYSTSDLGSDFTSLLRLNLEKLQPQHDPNLESTSNLTQQKLFRRRQRSGSRIWCLMRPPTRRSFSSASSLTTLARGSRRGTR